MIFLETSLNLSAVAVMATLQQAPVAVDDRVVTAADLPVGGSLLENDVSGFGDARVSEVEGGEVGAQFRSALGAAVTIGADGAFVYDPAGGFMDLPVGATRIDRIAYEMRDSGGASRATLEVTVSGINLPPRRVASLGQVSFILGAPIAPTQAAIAFDDPGDTLTFSADGLPAGLAIDPASGAISGAPAETVADRTVRITAIDRAGQIAEASLRVSVRAPGPILLGPVPAVVATSAGPITPVLLASRFAAEPAPVIFATAPGSAALPGGLTLSATGVLQGTAVEHVPEDRITLVRAFTADGGYADAAVPVRAPEIFNMLPVTRPTLTVENATVQTIGDVHRVTIANNRTYAIASYEARLIAGETYELIADVARGTATGAIRARVGGYKSNLFPQSPYPIDLAASAPDSMVATGSFVAVANGASGEAADRHLVHIIFSGAAGQYVDIGALRLRPISARAVQAAAATLFPPVYETPIVGAVRDVVRQRGVETEIDLSTYATNFSFLTVDPSSDPLPTGLSLSGRTLRGAPRDHGASDLVLRAWNDAGEYELLRFEARIADVAAELSTAAPLWRAGEPVDYAVGALFAFVPETVTLLGDSEPLVDGLIFDDATQRITGMAVGVSAMSSGERLRFRAIAGDRAQELTLRVWVGAPLVSADATGLSLRSGSVSMATLEPTGDMLARTTSTTSTAPTSSAELRFNGSTNVRLRRSFSIADPAMMLTMRVRLWRNRPGDFHGLVTYDPSGATARQDWNSANGTIGHDNAVITRSFVAGATTGEVSFEIQSLKEGDVFVLAEFEIFDSENQPVILTGRAFPTEVSPDAPMTVDARAFFINAIRFTATGLPTGATIDADTGEIVVDGAAEGTYDITVTGASGMVARTETFPLTVAAGRYSYPGANFGPRTVDQSRYRGVATAVAQESADSWRVMRRQGDVAMALHRLWGLTRGARYRITIPTGMGSLSPTAEISAWAAIHTDRLGFIDGNSGATPLGAWKAASSGIAEVEFVAPDNAAWIIVEAEAASAQFFTLGRIRVEAVAGDEYAAAPRIDQNGTRLFGLEHGRRYRLTSAGARRIEILRGAEVTDVGDGESLTFIAQHEILGLRTDGAAPALEDVTGAPHYLAPPPEPEAGARYPFLHAYPATPPAADFVIDAAGGAQFATLQDALMSTAVETAARARAVTILARGALGAATVTGRRFAHEVTVISDGQHAAQASRINLDDVRRLTLRGLRITGTLTVARVQDITLMNNLFIGSSDGARQCLSSGGGEIFNLRVLSNDFIGSPRADLGLAFAGNPVTNAIGLFNLYHSQIAGNRLYAFRADGAKLGGQRIAFDHNLILDAYSAQGTDSTGRKISDHADSVQLQQPFLRYNSWHSYRMNVIADDVTGFTGGGPLMHGLWSGNQLAGLIGMHVEQNAIHSMNDVWGVGHGDVVLDYRVLRNTLWGRGGLAAGGQRWIGWANGVAEGNVTRVNNAPVRRTGNHSYGATSRSEIWVNPSSIYGLAYRTGGPGDGGPAAGLGADQLIARLAAQPAAPAALPPGAWDVQPGVATGQLIVTLRAPAMGRDTEVTRYEWTIDDGATWTSFGTALRPPTAMTATISGAPSGAQRVMIRAVAGVVGEASTPKTATAP